MGYLKDLSLQAERCIWGVKVQGSPGSNVVFIVWKGTIFLLTESYCSKKL